MSLATRAGDLYFTFRFIKLLTTPWEETDAFKLGIVDGNGKRIKSKKISTSEEKDAFTTFHRLAFNVKRLLSNVPGGSSRLASYAAALFLIRENFNVTDEGLQNLCNKLGIDPLDFIAENSDWYQLGNNQIAPGIYRVRNDKLISSTLDEYVFSKDKIRVGRECFPVSEVFGVKVYEGTHLNTGQTIHFTLKEIYK